MIIRTAKSKTVAALLMAGVLSGCSTQNPAWLSKPAGAYCASQLTKRCLQEFAQSAYAEATRRLAAKSAVAEQTKTTAAHDKPDDSGQVALESTEAGKGAGTQIPLAESKKSDEVHKDPQPANKLQEQASPSDEGSLPILGFGAGAIGASVSNAEGFTPSDHLKQAIAAGGSLDRQSPSASDILQALNGIQDKALKAKVLFNAISLNGASMTEGQSDSLINELYSLDQARYADALLVKLPGLLKRGDLERALALRKILLRSDKGTDRFSMLAYVASCYSMAGLKADAGDIVQESLGQGSSLDLDDKKLIGMAIKVGDGSYPMMQEFYDYRSDEIRLQAYLTIALVSRQLNRPDLARRAIGDAVRFIQKAATQVDHEKALGELLALTPGLLTDS